MRFSSASRTLDLDNGLQNEAIANFTFWLKVGTSRVEFESDFFRTIPNLMPNVISATTFIRLSSSCLNLRPLPLIIILLISVLQIGTNLIEKSSTLDFGHPAHRLESHENFELRSRVLALTSYQADQIGISKSSLYYLRTRAHSNRPFKVYSKVARRLAVELRR